MQALQLRLATSGDLATVFQIHQDSVSQLCRHQYSSEQVEHWFDGRSIAMYQQGVATGRLWVACGPQLLGFVETDATTIDKLFVAPAAAGQGVGRFLLQQALADLNHRGVRNIVIEATLTAAPFYQRHGFHELERTVFSHGSNVAPLEIVKMQWQGTQPVVP